jgi:hypothetical protein
LVLIFFLFFVWFLGFRNSPAMFIFIRFYLKFSARFLVYFPLEGASGSIFWLLLPFVRFAAKLVICALRGRFVGIHSPIFPFCFLFPFLRYSSLVA